MEDATTGARKQDSILALGPITELETSPLQVSGTHSTQGIGANLVWNHL